MRPGGTCTAAAGGKPGLGRPLQGILRIETEKDRQTLTPPGSTWGTAAQPLLLTSLAAPSTEEPRSSHTHTHTPDPDNPETLILPPISQDLGSQRGLSQTPKQQYLGTLGCWQHPSRYHQYCAGARFQQHTTILQPCNKRGRGFTFGRM